MKISDVVKELEHIKESHGDMPVQLQDDGKGHESELITGYESFFMVPEEYPDDGWMCNIRWWPY